jgi:hypothetical protein
MYLIPIDDRSLITSLLQVSKVSNINQMLYIMASFLFLAFFFVSLGQVFWVCPPATFKDILQNLTTQMATLQLIRE